MKTNIFVDRCLELGLPAPFEHEKQIEYLTRLLTNAIELNTRITRVIGIANLHSLIPILKKKGIKFEHTRKLAVCPITRQLPQNTVNHIWMTSEQIRDYQEEKRR